MDNKKPSLKKRIQYWFDEEMSKGIMSLVKFMVIAIAIAIVLITLIIYAMPAARGENFAALLWNNMAYTLNRWVPFSGDVAGYQMLIPTTISSIIGILFTSILIGIISSAIEIRVTKLRRGTSAILEKGHIVILGYYPGEYALIASIVKSVGNQKAVIVVAGNAEKDTMEDDIRRNVDIPKNVKMICRSADICDPQSISCCSLPQCKAVAVSPASDEITVQATLAAASILMDYPENKVRIIAAVESDEAMIPARMREKCNIFMFKTNEMIGKMIARSCTVQGITGLFNNVFSCKGKSVHIESFENIAGRTFAELIAATKNAVPVGFVSAGSICVNPPLETTFNNGDKLIYFSKSDKPIEFDFNGDPEIYKGAYSVPDEKTRKIVVFGYSKIFKTIVSKLQKSVDEIVLVDKSFDEDFICEGRKITVFKGDPEDEESINRLIADKDHLVFLNGDSEGGEQSDKDYRKTLRLLRMVGYRLYYGHHYTITAGVASERTRRMIRTPDKTDFVVSGHVISIMLANAAVHPELSGLFRELFADGGYELFLKSQKELNIPQGEYKAEYLRQMLCTADHVLLGYCKDKYDTDSMVIPYPGDIVKVDEDTNFAVLGKRGY